MHVLVKNGTPTFGQIHGFWNGKRHNSTLIQWFCAKLSRWILKFRGAGPYRREIIWGRTTSFEKCEIAPPPHRRVLSEIYKYWGPNLDPKLSRNGSRIDDMRNRDRENDRTGPRNVFRPTRLVFPATTGLKFWGTGYFGPNRPGAGSTLHLIFALTYISTPGSL